MGEKLDYYVVINDSNQPLFKKSTGQMYIYMTEDEAQKAIETIRNPFERGRRVAKITFLK